MYISLQDMFKIGIGPSSSHTVGPMRAARRFLLELPDGLLAQAARVQVELFGSLAHTGIGHGTDHAVLMGLCGEIPDDVDTGSIASRIQAIEQEQAIILMGTQKVHFERERDLVFNFVDELPLHTNGMRFRLWDGQGALLAERELYSIGGGFVVDADEHFVGSARGAEVEVPYPFSTMQELLALAEQEQLPISDLLMANESALHGRDNTIAFIRRIADRMLDCVARGMRAEGVLPGGLDVPRRARGMADRLTAAPLAAAESAMSWVSAWAIAVNEENASGGRVVTAPTNGAAGVVPAVLRYLIERHGHSEEGIQRYFLVAAAVGGLCKRNASISGAEVGCQGEVGSAAAMAAAGLAAAMGASNARIENAAEIALEHHLGMTCDPIAGLVQVPCIERNAMGAVKAINACSMSLLGTGVHLVSLDQAITTMRETGRDMQSRYKETSLGGLAVVYSLRQVEC